MAKDLQDNVIEFFQDLIEEGRKFVERVDCCDDDDIESDDADEK